MNDHQSLSGIIAANVKAIRTGKGLRQVDVADQVGGTLTRLALSTSELGNREIKVSELPGLCRVLGVGLEDLMAGSNDLPAMFPHEQPREGIPPQTVASALWPLLEPMVRDTVRATLRESFNA